MLKLIERPASRNRWSTTNSAPTCSILRGSTSASSSEMDTYATHGDRTTFEKDRARDARPERMGVPRAARDGHQVGVRTVARLAATLSR